MSKRESDRQAAEARAEDVRRQIDEGKTIGQIMADKHEETSMALLKRALEEG